MHLGLGLRFNRSASDAWSPARLGPSLLGWWTADRADLLTLSGAQVTSWKDVVAGYDLAQAIAGSRPIYSASSFNGAPGVTFDGVDDYLNLESVPFPVGANPSEIWTVLDQTSGNDVIRRIFEYGGQSGATRRGTYKDVIGSVNRANSILGTNTATNVSATNTTVDFTGRHLVRAIFSATGVSLSVDGGATSFAAGVPATTATRTRLAATTQAVPANFLGGRIRDQLVTAELSAAQSAALQDYLLKRRLL